MCCQLYVHNHTNWKCRSETVEILRVCFFELSYCHLFKRFEYTKEENWNKYRLENDRYNKMAYGSQKQPKYETNCPSRTTYFLKRIYCISLGMIKFSWIFVVNDMMAGLGNLFNISIFSENCGQKGLAAVRRLGSITFFNETSPISNYCT